MGGGVCQALFLGRQADADVYCINTTNIYKRGGVDSASLTRGGVWRDWTVGGVGVRQWRSERVMVYKQMLEKKCRGRVKVRRCGDTFHLPGNWTLYLKVTPFDSNTPTHQRTKVPIGGICVAAKPHSSETVPLLIIISLSPPHSFALNTNDSHWLYSVACLAFALYYH